MTIMSGQVYAAVHGVVGDEDVAALELAAPDLGLRPDAGAHAAEVDGEVGRVGDEAAGRDEEGAAVVEALFNVRADRGLL